MVIANVRSARSTLREEVREGVLLAAARILLEDGATALTIRRVAEEVNASTKVVYTLFGGKDGLLDALYLHSFGRFGEVLVDCRHIVPPEQRLAEMCRRYRAFARGEPALYQVMFGDLGRAYSAPAALRDHAWSTFELVAEAIAEATGRLDRAEVADDTRVLWAAMHGCVSLELRGLLKDEGTATGVFERCCAATMAQVGVVLFSTE